MNKPFSPLDLESQTDRSIAAFAGPGLLTGVVEGAGPDAGTWTVSEENRSVKAQRAASCLIEPQEGDKVLLALTGTDEAFLLAVLVRHSDQDLVLAGPAEGKLTVAADQLHLDTRSLSVSADTGHLVIGELSLVGRIARIVHDVAEAVAKRLSWSAETATGSAETYVRTTKGTDLVTGNVVSRRAEHAMIHESAQTVLTATGEMRIDAKRIDMG